MRIPLSLFDALTGLSDALRGETRSYENGVLVASSRESFDAATTNAVVVSWAADGGVSTNVLRFGRTLETVSPEGRTLVFHDSYGYPYLTQRSDPTGNLLSKIYADGSVETHTYTADGLPLRTTFPGGRWVENRYDGNRRLAGVSSDDPSCEAEYAYDAFGAILSASGPLADAFNIRYSTKYYDAESDLYYYGYRYYAPQPPHLRRAAFRLMERLLLEHTKTM